MYIDYVTSYPLTLLRDLIKYNICKLIASYLHTNLIVKNYNAFVDYVHPLQKSNLPKIITTFP